MKKVSEESYGARLLRARQIRDAVNTYSTFTPPNSDDSIANLDLLLTACDTSNNTVAVAINNYNAATTTRSKAFHTDTISVLKLLSPISRLVMAQYGKDSQESNIVKRAIDNIREAKVIKKINADGSITKISQSEQSYGSLTTAFRGLVSVVGSLNGYTVSRPELEVAALTAFADNLDVLNQNVNNTQNALANARITRNTNFDDLKTRIARIKNYVSGTYGYNSAEHRRISKLAV